MTHQPLPPHVQLATMSRWYVVSRAIHAIAALGIANYLEEKPISIQELAKKTKTEPVLLERMLRFLGTYDIVHYEPGQCSLTELSRPLRDDDPYSIRKVLCMVDENWWKAFSRMDICLKKNESGFFNEHGAHFFDFLEKFPEKQRNFDEGMAKLSNYDDDSISQAFPFDTCQHVIDMGGGKGGLSRSLSKHYPHLKITLFDTPQVISELDKTSFPAQITLEAGDFFKKIPQGDAYLFKGVLHDFNDELMKKILQNCRNEMPDKARLIIAEQVLPETQKPHPNHTMDMVMMVLLGGRQRNLEEWKHGIEPSGFHFTKAYPSKSLFTVMEFSKMKK